MTFREIFEGMHRKDPGVTSGALAGVDGLTVEEWRAPGDDRDLSALCASPSSFSGVRPHRDGERLGAAKSSTSEGPRAGLPPQGGPGYFLVIVAAPGTVPGKCRSSCARRRDRRGRFCEREAGVRSCSSTVPI